MDHLDFKKKGTNAYSQLFLVIRALGLPYESMEEAFRRMVFNVMARNCDDHTKNFSFRQRQVQGL
jgi:serine/threonine-protein kinase HipA